MADRTSEDGHSLPPHAGNGRSAGPIGSEASEEEISLQEVFEVLRRQKWLVLTTILVLLALVGTYIFMTEPEYEANSLLYVNKQQSTPQLGRLLDLQGSNGVANEVELLKSRTIALGVAERLLQQRHLPNSDTLLSILETKSEERLLTPLQVMKRLQGRYVEIQPVGSQVDLIDVVGASVYPKEAALIADLYAEEYVEYNRAMSRQRMKASKQFLSDMTERFRDELELAEDTLRTYLNQAQVVAPEAEVQNLLNRITTLRQRKFEAQLEMAAARTQLRDLRTQIETIQPELAEEIASSDDAVLSSLRGEIGRLTAQIERKYAKNPSLQEDPSQDREIVQWQEQIRELQEKVNERAERLVERAVRTAGLGPEEGEGAAAGASEDGELPVTGSQVRLNRLRGLQSRILGRELALRTQETRVEAIDGELAELEGQVRQMPNQELILDRLRRSMRTQEDIYLSLIKQLQEARVAEQSEVGYVNIVDESIVPTSPVWPKPRLLLALALVLGGILGVGLAFVRNALDNRVHTPEELKKRGYSVVGTIPDMSRLIEENFDGRERVAVDGHTYSAQLVTLLSPLSPVAESYRRLRTNVQFSRLDTEVQTIMVTSAEPGEGKSVTSMNLAIAMAQAGRRTVYVDADLRRATGHQLMGVPQEPGLVDLLVDSFGSLESFATDVDDLYVVPSGSAVPNPAEVVGSKKMRAFIAHLEKHFEAVIIDSPPVLAVTDAQLIAPVCDVTVLVCAADRTEWNTLHRSVEALQEVRAQTAGVLLNRFASEASAYGRNYEYGPAERERKFTSA